LCCAPDVAALHFASRLEAHRLVDQPGRLFVQRGPRRRILRLGTQRCGRRRQALFELDTIAAEGRGENADHRLAQPLAAVWARQFDDEAE
jgi:hypothetical protein